MSQQHEEMESKFSTEIEDLTPKEEELKVGNALCNVCCVRSLFCLDYTNLLVVGSNPTIAINRLIDWLKNLAPVF